MEMEIIIQEIKTVNDNAIIANIITEKEFTLIVTWSRACIDYSMWEAFGL